MYSSSIEENFAPTAHTMSEFFLIAEGQNVLTHYNIENHKTGVINDPPGQAVVPAGSDFEVV